jgi:hypothetical protein
MSVRSAVSCENWRHRPGFYTGSKGNGGGRAYSFTKDVPEDVHVAVIDSLQRERLQEAEGHASLIEVPNRISIVIVSPPDQTE